MIANVINAALTGEPLSDEATRETLDFVGATRLFEEHFPDLEPPGSDLLLAWARRSSWMSRPNIESAHRQIVRPRIDGDGH